MCFTQEVSAIIALSGLATVAFAKIYFAKVPGLWRLYVPILYFVGMEVLQFFQYFLVDECTFANKVSTIIAYVHVSFQSIFLNMTLSFSGNRTYFDKYIMPFSFLAGVLMVSSLFVYPGAQMCDPEHDILCGEETCTTMGLVHLKWNLALRAENYFTGGPSMHILMFFGPFLVFKDWIGFLWVFLTGPVLSYLIGGGMGPTGNKDEWASIWCFYSVFLSSISILSNFRELMRLKEEYEKKEE